MENSKSKIIKVRKNNDGDITNILTNDGNIYSIEEAITMAKDHNLDGVNVGKSRNGTEYLRSNPNGEEQDNLDNLPTF